MVQEVQECIANNPYVIVNFYKPTCPFCSYVEPLFKAVREKYSDSITFLDIDITDESQAFKDAFNFSSVPTFVYFKKGRAVKSHGSKNKHLTQEDIEEIIQDLYF